MLIYDLQRFGRRTSRRAFNSHLAWYRDLRRLPYLEEFALRTAAPLVRRIGDWEFERRLVLSWASGVRFTRRTPASSVPHPNLYHIRVLYGPTSSTAALSKWFKDSGEWMRLGAPVTGIALKDIDF